MKVHGDIESVSLSTGERQRRVAGDGESRLEIDRGFVDVRRLGPSDDIKFGPREHEPTPEEIVRQAEIILKLDDKGNVVAFGVLHSAVPGNDYCNGSISTIQPPNDYTCMVDCLHVEDVAALPQREGTR